MYIPIKRIQLPKAPAVQPLPPVESTLKQKQNGHFTLYVFYKKDVFGPEVRAAIKKHNPDMKLTTLIAIPYKLKYLV